MQRNKGQNDKRVTHSWEHCMRLSRVQGRPGCHLTYLSEKSGFFHCGNFQVSLTKPMLFRRSCPRGSRYHCTQMSVVHCQQGQVTVKVSFFIKSTYWERKWATHENSSIACLILNWAESIVARPCQILPLTYYIEIISWCEQTSSEQREVPTWCAVECIWLHLISKTLC